MGYGKFKFLRKLEKADRESPIRELTSLSQVKKVVGCQPLTGELLW